MVGLLPGEGPEDVAAEDRLAYEITCRDLSDGWTDDVPGELPDLAALPPGPYLAVLLEHIERSGLNGFDLVRLLQARERQLAHLQAQGMADVTEISYAAPGDGLLSRIVSRSSLFMRLMSSVLR